jgi:hypothetical protein
MLLSDVFEEFRGTAQDAWSLDAALYPTLPSLGWDGLLKTTTLGSDAVRLELLTDPDMYMMCESAMRGGLCCGMERHAKANNPMVEGFDAYQPTSYIMYDDANNLYGQPMIESRLPVSDFTWGLPQTYTADYITAMSDDANTGAFLEVDCYFPDDTHDALSDYPPMPVPREVLREELSPYQNALIEDTMGGRYAPCRKLVPDLKPRVNYVVHYRVLAYALKLGIRLTKVHRVLEFTQRAWMEPYITANTKRRALATSKFEKDFWKLASNCGSINGRRRRAGAGASS